MTAPFVHPPRRRPPLRLRADQGVRLGVVREAINAAVVGGKKVLCPACEQRVSAHDRRLQPDMAYVLVVMHALHGRSWVPLAQVVEEAGVKRSNEAKLRFWGLIEPKSETDPEPGDAAGLFRVTDIGAAFVNGMTKVPSVARVYNDRVFEMRGDPVGVVEALAPKYRFEDATEAALSLRVSEAS